MNIPNIITLGRVMLVPVVFWLILSGRPGLACVAFIVAGISDAVDGYLAKRWNQQTRLGAYLDPMADKLLLVTVFVALGALGEVPIWLVIAIVSRDVLIVLAIAIAMAMETPVKIAPLAISKANTAAQIVLAAIVLADSGFHWDLGSFRWAFIWITLGLTVVSLLAYLRLWLRHMDGAQVN